MAHWRLARLFVLVVLLWSTAGCGLLDGDGVRTDGRTDCPKVSAERHAQFLEAVAELRSYTESAVALECSEYGGDLVSASVSFDAEGIDIEVDGLVLPTTGRGSCGVTSGGWILSVERFLGESLVVLNGQNTPFQNC